jgi:hypothetical protein
VKSSNTAVTDADKIAAARLKDAEKNIDLVKDPESDERTASHLAAEGRLPSDIEAYANQHTLTVDEAARALDAIDGGAKEDVAIDEIVRGRTVMQKAYVETPAGLSHPLAPQPDVPPAPEPPAAQDLDPVAPARDDPTGFVIREEDLKPTPAEVVDEYAGELEEVIAKADEAVAEGEDTRPQIPVE